MAETTWGEILDQLGGSASEDDGGFRLLPKAKYVVRVIKARVKEASTGKPGLGVTWSVAVGPEKGGVVHKDFWVDTEDAQQMGNFVRAMKVMGATFTDMPGDFEAGLEQIADEIMGGYAVVQVDHRNWQGEPRHEVAPWNVKRYEGPALEEGPSATPEPAAPPSSPPPSSSASSGDTPNVPF